MLLDPSYAREVAKSKRSSSAIAESTYMISYNIIVLTLVLHQLSSMVWQTYSEVLALLAAPFWAPRLAPLGASIRADGRLAGRNAFKASQLRQAFRMLEESWSFMFASRPKINAVMSGPLVHVRAHYDFSIGACAWPEQLYL